MRRITDYSSTREELLADRLMMIIHSDSTPPSNTIRSKRELPIDRLIMMVHSDSTPLPPSRSVQKESFPRISWQGF
jgi:hypothetical protein